MDTSTEGAIVVGVTGPGEETAALRFAAAAAAQQRAEIVLVHAYGGILPPPPPSVLMSDADAADVAVRVVKGVEEELGDLGDGAVSFRTVTVAGMPSHVLVELSRRARLLVVQHRDPRRLGQFFVGSTVNGTAAHAECPVVSVPRGWEPPAAPGPVVVGVHEGGAPAHVVAAGLDWAAAAGASLRLVHAWRLDSAYDDIITARVAEDWRDERARALEASVRDLRAGRPPVPVSIEVRHEWPAQALVEESEVASLVVVGRHAGHWPATTHLGSLARTVLREARCPVMVVPPLPVTDDWEDWALDAAEVSPQT